MIFTKTPLKESDLFLPLKEHFEAEGYEVFAEVPCGGYTPDIVARKNDIYIVIEMKTSMNLSLIEQVFRWKQSGVAHLVYAAVPRKADIRLFSRELLRNAGIGLLVLDITNDYGEVHCSRICKYVSAKLHRGPLSVRWDQYIIPEHSQNIAGVQHADIKVSRYKLMMKHVRRLINSYPEGISMDDIADKIDTYYANPKSSLYNALKVHESNWCEPFKKPGDRKTYFRLIS